MKVINLSRVSIEKQIKTYFKVLPFAGVLFNDLLFSGFSLLIVNGITNITASVLLFMNKKQDMTTQPESGKKFPLTVKLTVSAVIAQMITFLYNTADSMFVAKIDGSAMDAPAALGIVLSVTLIMIVIFTTFPKIFKRREEYVKNCPRN